MRGRKILIIVVATLVGIGAWEIFARPEAQAGITSFPHLGIICYQTNSKPLNQHLRLFDRFHDDPVGPDAGGESVTVKGSRMICTAITGKCLLDRDPPVCVTASGSPIDALNCFKITPPGPPVNETREFSDNGAVIHIPNQDLKIKTAQFFCEGGNLLPSP